MKKQYSIAELAEITGANKQQVYRFIRKNHIKPASKANQKLFFDDKVKSTIMSEFTDNSTSKESHQTTSSEMINEMVLNQLTIKDQEISRLQTMLDQQQKLTLQTNNQIANLQDKLLLLESQSKEKSIAENITSNSENETKKHWWNRH